MIKIMLSMSLLASLIWADNNYGASGTTSEIPENLESSSGGVKPKEVEYTLQEKKSVPLSEGLQEKLKTIDSNERIEVEVHLERVEKEEAILEASVKAHLRNAEVVENISTEVQNSELSSLIKGADRAEQVEFLQQEHKKNLEKNRSQRIKKMKAIRKGLNFIKDENIVSFNLQSGILKATLTSKEIEKLSKRTKDVALIKLPSVDKPDLASAFDAIHLDTTSFPVRIYGGDGVGIYMREGWHTGEPERPCFDESEVTPVETLIGLGGGDYTEDRVNESRHANLVAQTLRAASPESHIYCSDEVYSLPSAWKNNIHVVNYSWHAGSDSGIAYTSADESAEDMIWNDNVLIFVASGNACGGSVQGCDVNSPGKAHNVLTVGAYDDTTNEMANYSDWRNPATGAMKPEVLAPGGGHAWNANLMFAGDLGRASGTSLASPLAAGMAASNISLMPSMKKHAALIKASMLAMATKTNLTDHDNSQRNGATGIQWNPDGWYSWYEWANTSLNGADGAWMEIGSYNLRSNESVRVALSWLNREEVCDGSIRGNSYTAEPSHLCMDLAFKITNPSGNTVLFEDTANQNWEAGEFNTGSGGIFKVYVWRTRNKYEWSRAYPWSSKKYYRNDVKMGLRIAYIDNRNN